MTDRGCREEFRRSGYNNNVTWPIQNQGTPELPTQSMTKATNTEAHRVKRKDELAKD